MSTEPDWEERPLPPNPFAAPGLCSEAYDLFLRSEAAAVAGSDETRLMYVRVLGYLIAEIRTEEGQLYIAKDVKDCYPDPEKMDTLALFYINHFLRLFRQTKGRTPAPSSNPSRDSSELHQNLYASGAVTPVPKNHGAAKASALRRDNYRCMITRKIDRGYVKALPLAERQNIWGADVAHTNFCHILSPPTNWNIDTAQLNQPKVNFAGSVWTIINSIASIDLLAEPGGAKCHSLYNGMTLCVELHDLFNELDLWFEAVGGEANKYMVVTSTAQHQISSLQKLPQPAIITFTSTDPTLPLPDPRYLALHAAFNRDLEQTSVFAYDGSAAALLSSSSFVPHADRHE
ncbi:hypothetical protein MD484_g1648, partial [Candolleomyces efflorescens]